MRRRLGRGGRLVLVACAATAASPVGAAVSCSASASGVVFGTYSPLSATPLNSNGTVTVSCTLLSGGSTTVSMTIALSAGTSGSFAARTLAAGTQQLRYNLYVNSGHTQVWGDGSGGSSSVAAALPLTAASPTQQTSRTLHGQIGAGQDVGAGSYLDTLVVTIIY